MTDDKQQAGCHPVNDELWTPEKRSVREDLLIDESPLALVYNGISHAVMMVTPIQLNEFVLGFSLTEGIIDSPNELYDLVIEQTPDGYTAQCEIASRCFDRLKGRRRQMAGRSGCGLCGIESLQMIVTRYKAVNSLSLKPEAVEAAILQLNQSQPLQQATGASHGAAWCSLEGAIQWVGEDVGRHNALDKLIGWLCSSGVSREGFVLVSSRASFEMVQKAVAAQIGAMVTVSAATALAVEQAKSHGLYLVGFARPGRHVIYSSGAPESQ